LTQSVHTGHSNEMHRLVVEMSLSSSSDNFSRTTTHSMCPPQADLLHYQPTLEKSPSNFPKIFLSQQLACNFL